VIIVGPVITGTNLPITLTMSIGATTAGTMPWDPVEHGWNRHDRRAKAAKARRKVDSSRRRR